MELFPKKKHLKRKNKKKLSPTVKCWVFCFIFVKNQKNEKRND